MTDEIKSGPCPWCGGTATIQRSAMAGRSWVQCDDDGDCGSAGPWNYSEGIAIAAWNRVSNAVHGGKSDE